MRAFAGDTSWLGTAVQPMVPTHHTQHRLSRRGFMGGAAAMTAGLLGTGMLSPARAFGAGQALRGKGNTSAPKPTTNISSLNGVDFHLTFFGPGLDPSSITDFNGFVGVADVQGTGLATKPDGSTETLLFDTDMRFMSGVYVGQDGAVHKGAFGFV
jgi:hypothetical protein